MPVFIVVSQPEPERIRKTHEPERQFVLKLGHARPQAVPSFLWPTIYKCHTDNLQSCWRELHCLPITSSMTSMDQTRVLTVSTYLLLSLCTLKHTWSRGLDWSLRAEEFYSSRNWRIPFEDTQSTDVCSFPIFCNIHRCNAALANLFKWSKTSNRANLLAKCAENEIACAEFTDDPRRQRKCDSCVKGFHENGLR